MKNATIDFTRINNDVNGNPRYVCHFLSIISEADRVKAEEMEKSVKPFQFSISHLYAIAIKKANKIGGRKYHTKNYGGGIVFQSFNVNDLEKTIIELSNK
jgi:hypothetical protein